MANYTFSYDPSCRRGKAVGIVAVNYGRSRQRGVSPVIRWDQWVLDISIEDCGSCRVGESGEWLDRSAGWAHLYPPGTRYREAHPGLTAYACASVVFDGAEELELAGFAANSRRFGRIYDPELAIGRRLEVLARQGAENGNRGHLAAVGRLYELAGFLVNHLRRGKADYLFSLAGGSGQDPPGGDLAERVRSYLEVHFRQPVALDAVARALGVSRSTLSHRYREAAGESVFTSLNRIRIEQSLPMLIRRERLKHIARACGFADEFHYSRAFKKIHGVAPSRYRPDLPHEVTPSMPAAGK